MIGQLRNSSFLKILWGLIGLYLFNISVDTTDPHPQQIPEDLTINDQESIVEIILEEILNYEDAIKEYDDHDSEDHNKKANVKIDIIAQYAIDSNNKQTLSESSQQKFFNYESSLTKGFQKLATPPPKI